MNWTHGGPRARFDESTLGGHWRRVRSSPHQPCVSSGAAARSSRSPAASTRASAPACARARSGRSTCSLRLPERDIGHGASDLGLELAETLGARTEEESISPRSRARLLPPPRRGDPRGLPRLRAGAGATRSCAPRPAASSSFSLVVERPDGRARSGADPGGHLPRADRRDEHEAARAQAHRVHVGRLARLRRDRHAQPARVRPGLLRQGRRRPRRHQADRAALQDAGLRARARSRPAGRRSPSAHPTTETFSLPQTQEEFYFGHPYERMDLLLWGATTSVARGRAGAARRPRRRRRRGRPTGRSSAAASRPLPPRARGHRRRTRRG